MYANLMNLIVRFVSLLYVKNKENKIKLNKIFDEYDIECRPIVAGNLLKHPFLSKWKDSVNTPNANLLNDNGIYIGNSQFVTIEMIDKAFEHIKRICQ
jgi:CDP-6-deoxy-D-xylo-4-hexulose-3-dehydrase